MRQWVESEDSCYDGLVAIELFSTITCPECGGLSTEIMPTNACQFFYDCKGCGQRLKPKTSDCCVFCSYGSVPCPPVQQEREVPSR